MNLTEQCFQKCKKSAEGVLITYFPMGDGNYDAVELAEVYLENGADILEIGLPIPDPSLDGRVIAETMSKALALHPDVEWYFEQIARIRQRFPDAVLEAFTYKQIFEAVEESRFMDLLRQSGVDCILITDFTDAERDAFREKLPGSVLNLNFVPFCADDAQLNALRAKDPQGYVFFQSTDGATGARDQLEGTLGERIRQVKSILDKVPVCAGFGLSTPRHCSQVMEMGADGVIVGSFVVDYVSRHAPKEIGAMLRNIKAAM